MESGGGETTAAAAVKNPDKSKRDEWSEGGVMSLLDEYESKWLLRNRAKLKGSDWEEIARQVSVRHGGTKPVKTPNQCKNKIESMKKRYRAESSVKDNDGSVSSWHYFSRMDGLLKGTHCLQPKGGENLASNGSAEACPKALLKVVDDMENERKRVNDNGPAPQAQAQAQSQSQAQAQAQAQGVEKARNGETLDVEVQAHIRDCNHDDGSNTIPDNSESSAPRSKIANAGDGSLKINPFKRRKSGGSDVAESMRFLAHSILKIEQARIEMYKDSERLRVEAEIRRAEMELKRTEIIAKTQLQIAKLFVNRQRSQNNRTGSSSLSAEAIVTTKDTQEKNG
ncbi:hypothetical protein L1049_004580 [Liquidambar formosana]|uniref:Myb/SANT-like DNA-binding domain-containing protein n=1 Tax=Liquidambar formosana TaxID=63359 RepID=A0AAP0RNP7_LIQFO